MVLALPINLRALRPAGCAAETPPASCGGLNENFATTDVLARKGSQADVLIFPVQCPLASNWVDKAKEARAGVLYL